MSSTQAVRAQLDSTFGMAIIVYLQKLMYIGLSSSQWTRFPWNLYKT
jgi:hypothetical protein